MGEGEVVMDRATTLSMFWGMRRERRGDVRGDVSVVFGGDPVRLRLMFQR